MKIKQDIRKGKIKSTWKGSHIDNLIRFKIYINGANDVTKQESELFATLAEAEEALKKLEEV